MQTIGINSISAAHEAASAIAGLGENFRIASGILATREVAAGRPFTELQLLDEHDANVGCSVTIERPRIDAFRPDGGIVLTEINHSSASSRDRSTAAAKASAELIAFAAAVADKLDAWALDGQLAYLAAGE